MKKFILLAATGLTIVSAQGQQNNSIVLLNHDQQSLLNRIHEEAVPVTRKTSTRFMPHPNANSAHKTTNGNTYMDWYNLWGQNATTSSQSYYFAAYQDSNLYDNTNSRYTFFHGMGMSFDPTDLSYSGNAAVTAITNPVTQSDAYIVDSFFVPFNYVRNDNTNNGDSIIVELAVVPIGPASNGVFALQFHASDTALDISADSVVKFCTGLYTPSSNSMHAGIASAAQPQRYSFSYTASNINDTDINGFNFVLMALNPALAVPAGSKVVSYVHPKSGTAYSHGTTYSTSNYFKFYAGLPGGMNVWFAQTPHNLTSGYLGSYQSGLAGTTQAEYPPYFTYNSNPLLVPSVAYAWNPQPSGFDVPQCAFHVIWNDSNNVGPTMVNQQTLNSSNVYPNPANTVVSISFSTNHLANVTVSIINTLGQTVKVQEIANVTNGKATFNTSDLASGVYIYTISANGERSTGRLVITH